MKFLIDGEEASAAPSHLKLVRLGNEIQLVARHPVHGECFVLALLPNGTITRYTGVDRFGFKTDKYGLVTINK